MAGLWLVKKKKIPKSCNHNWVAQTTEQRSKLSKSGRHSQLHEFCDPTLNRLISWLYQAGWAARQQIQGTRHNNILFPLRCLSAWIGFLKQLKALLLIAAAIAPRLKRGPSHYQSTLLSGGHLGRKLLLKWLENLNDLLSFAAVKGTNIKIILGGIYLSAWQSENFQGH